MGIAFPMAATGRSFTMGTTVDPRPTRTRRTRATIPARGAPMMHLQPTSTRSSLATGEPDSRPRPNAIASCATRSNASPDRPDPPVDHTTTNTRPEETTIMQPVPISSRRQPRPDPPTPLTARPRQRAIPPTLLGVWAHPDDEAYLSAGSHGAVRPARRTRRDRDGNPRRSRDRRSGRRGPRRGWPHSGRARAVRQRRRPRRRRRPHARISRWRMPPVRRHRCRGRITSTG